MEYSGCELRSRRGTLHPSPALGWVLVLSLLPLSQKGKFGFSPSFLSNSSPAQPAAFSTLTLWGSGCPVRNTLQWKVSLTGRVLQDLTLLLKLWLPGINKPPWGLTCLPSLWPFLLILRDFAASSPRLPLFLFPLPLTIPTLGPYGILHFAPRSLRPARSALHKLLCDFTSLLKSLKPRFYLNFQTTIGVSRDSLIYRYILF